MHVMEAAENQSRLTDKGDTTWYLFQTFRLISFTMHSTIFGVQIISTISDVGTASRYIVWWMCSFGLVLCYNVCFRGGHNI